MSKHKIEISLRRRTYRRDLPASWTDVKPARRLSLLRLLVRYPGALGQLYAIRALLKLPESIWKALSDDNPSFLLDSCPWLHLHPDPESKLLYFEYKGRQYHAPISHGLNLVALEYPIADEAFCKFVDSADEQALRLLCATLYREKNIDEQSVISRGDIRVPLRSRWEAEHRAKSFDDLPEEVTIPILLYFAGLKKYINRAYGKHLFEQPEEDENGNPIAPETTPNLGWWSVYFNLATDGPFGRNVEEVYQSPFHDVCLYLVDQKRQEARRQMQERMSAPDFGVENP